MRRLLTVAALALGSLLVGVSCGSSGAAGPAALTFTRLAGEHESVWVAAADGSHAREITADGYDSTLSPDGRWLTFEREQARPSADLLLLFLVDLVRGKTRPLGKTTGNERWASVGARLAVSQRRGFFLIDAISGKRTRLLRTPVSSFDFLPDGSSIVLAQARVARCCQTKWYYTHAGTIKGFETVGLSSDGKRLLACQPWEGGCYPVAIELPSGHRYTFPETRKLGTPKESATALDLTRDGRKALVVVSPWDDEPGARLLYSVPFGGGKPMLLARGVVFASWRS